jgi:hypothetical protein
LLHKLGKANNGFKVANLHVVFGAFFDFVKYVLFVLMEEHEFLRRALAVDNGPRDNDVASDM